MATVTIELPVSLEEARAEFDEAMRLGDFNSRTTFEDYLDLLHAREREKIRAKELGLTGDEGPELTEEDERILDTVWAQVAAENRAKRSSEQ